eukprot:SAG11_NODE_46258_length_138_cov_12.025641_1_plen_38_part_01
MSKYLLSCTVRDIARDQLKKNLVKVVGKGEDLAMAQVV